MELATAGLQYGFTLKLDGTITMDGWTELTEHQPAARRVTWSGRVSCHYAARRLRAGYAAQGTLDSVMQSMNRQRLSPLWHSD